MALFEKFLAGSASAAHSGHQDAEQQSVEGQADVAQRSDIEGQVEVPLSAPKTQGNGSKKLRGRPPLPDHLRKYPKRQTERHDENGRVIRKLRRRNNTGSKHWKVRRKAAREAQKRYRVKTGYRYVKQYGAASWRKYLQSRSWNRSVARKKGFDPDDYYQITFADWVRLWDETEDVWRNGRFYRPAELQNNPVRSRRECTWFARIDESKPFTPDNVCVRYRHHILRRKAGSEHRN